MKVLKFRVWDLIENRMLQWGEKIAIAGKSLITQLNLKATVMIGDCIKSETHIQNTEKNQSQNYYFVC